MVLVEVIPWEQTSEERQSCYMLILLPFSAKRKIFKLEKVDETGPYIEARVKRGEKKSFQFLQKNSCPRILGMLVGQKGNQTHSCCGYSIKVPPAGGAKMDGHRTQKARSRRLPCAAVVSLYSTWLVTSGSVLGMKFCRKRSPPLFHPRPEG